MKAINVLRGFLSESPSAVYPDEVLTYVDEIERELEERYIEGPIDADGVTIAPSDNMIDQKGEQFVVSSIELLASGEWLVYGNGKLGNEFAKLCHHHKPQTVEDVLREFVFDACGDSTPEEAVVKRFAERLQLKEDD